MMPLPDAVPNQMIIYAATRWLMVSRRLEIVRDVTFGEDASASRPCCGPANLATIRAAIITALKHAGYLHIPEGRRDHTTPAETLRLHSLD